LQVSHTTIEKYEGYLPYYRNDDHFIKSHGKRKAFHKGGNSSCRAHIRQHYNVYKEKRENANVPINHWAIPRPIWKAMEDQKEEERQGRTTKKNQQQKLRFETVKGPRAEFTRAGTLQAVTELVATNNQVC